MTYKPETKQAGYIIDWLRATKVVETGAIMAVRNNIQEVFEEVEWQYAELTPFSYNTGVECAFAGIYWNVDHPEFGLMLDMSGSRLAAARDAGLNDLNIIKRLHVAKWSITRLDLAMDVHNTGARPKDLYNNWQSGLMTTKARKVGIIQTREKAGVTGETVYFGARTSNVMIRCYDKAAEQGETGDRIRLEFELKREVANQTALSVLNQGLPRTIAALITEQITAGIPAWMRSATELEFEVVKIEASKDTNFERWFESTVLPAIEKAARINYPNLDKIIANAIRSGREGHGQ